MGNKVIYLLVCVLAMLAISACAPSEPVKVPKIGEPVPNISWTTISGEKIDLNQFKGSWVLLCYWCSCPEHRSDIEVIQDVCDALYDKNLKVVLIDDTSVYRPDASLETFAKEQRSPFYLIRDSQNSINNIRLKPVNLDGRPVYFLIDMSGNLHAIKTGGFQYFDKPSAQLPVNDFDAQAKASRLQPDQYQGKLIDVLIFLYDAIAIKFDDITITNITTRGATVSWKTDKVVPCQLWASLPRGSWPPRTQPSTTHECVLDGIFPNKTCVSTAIAASYDIGKLRLPVLLHYSSSEFSFTTLSDNLTEPQIYNAKVSKITDKSAEIYWETNVEANGTAKLIIQEVTDFKEDPNLVKKHVFIVDGLIPNQLYSVDLASEDSIGRSDTYHLGFVTQSLNYKTYGVEIFNINISNITDKSATISWSTDRAVKSNVCSHFACYEYTPISHDHSQTLSKLKSDTEYWVQLMVADDGGVSDVLNFKTLKADIK